MPPFDQFFTLRPQDLQQAAAGNDIVFLPDTQIWAKINYHEKYHFQKQYWMYPLVS